MKVLEEYDYELPKELIAKTPAHPRDTARLFVYDTKEDRISFGVFSGIDAYLEAGDLVVLNDTKVLPARVFIDVEGKQTEILFLLNEYHQGSDTITGIVGGKLEAGKVYPLTENVFLEVLGNEKNIFTFRLPIPYEHLVSILQEIGHTPIPPYLGETEMYESNLREEYQTVFAKRDGSVAAPTASLHFTEDVFARLGEKGIERAYTTLHVGLGTFSPVNEEMLAHSKLHREPYFVPIDTAHAIQWAKGNGRRVVAAGTTATRTLETAAQSILGGASKNISGETDLFIKPPYEFKVVDTLITNFHVPRSSLMCLVDAFLLHKKAPRRILDLYKIAINEKFRFFSFGDAMLIL